MSRVSSIAIDLMGLYDFWMTDAGLGVTIDEKMYSTKKCNMLYTKCQELYDGMTKREYKQILQYIQNRIKTLTQEFNHVSSF